MHAINTHVPARPPLARGLDLKVQHVCRVYPRVFRHEGVGAAAAAGAARRAGSGKVAPRGVRCRAGRAAGLATFGARHSGLRQKDTPPDGKPTFMRHVKM